MPYDVRPAEGITEEAGATAPEVAALVDKVEQVARRVLGRADLKARASAPRPREYVEVPEWEGSVLIEAMSGTARDSYEESIVGNRGGKDRRLNLTNLRARLVARCMINEDGTPVYDFHNPADIDELGSLDAAGLNRVFTACQRLNGITDEDVEQLRKNSKRDQNGVSGSD